MPKIINEAGNKYNRLLVLNKANKTNTKGELYWHCLCDCGKEVDVLGRLLRNGTTQSCGCLRKGSKTIDEIGNVYGLLTVISKADNKINNHIAWNCKCQCGKIIIVSGSKLRSGEKTSCSNCKKHFINETNNTYGDLQVLSFSHVDKKTRKAFWECLCSCGNKCLIAGTDLRQGNKTNCGCKKILSKGAQKIKLLLKELKINFIEEKTFSSCRFPDTNRLARFDFYLPDYNIIIEYDGEQHFFYTNHNWDTKEHFEYTKNHDQFKENWCKKNNIQIIRVPYYDYKQLTKEKILFLIDYYTSFKKGEYK